MIIITTLVFVVGIVVSSTHLKAYNDLPEPQKLGALTLPDIEAQPDAAGVDDSEPAIDNIDFDNFDSDM